MMSAAISQSIIGFLMKVPIDQSSINNRIFLRKPHKLKAALHKCYWNTCIHHIYPNFKVFEGVGRRQVTISSTCWNMFSPPHKLQNYTFVHEVHNR